ncbi:MAG: ISNCY family transposase, partial [Cyanobacteria bacterium J06635_11]
MPSTVLSFERLLGYLAAEIDNIADPRQRSNATGYSLRDAVLGGFSAFFMQSESFLDYQEQLNSEQGKNNAQSMFGLDQIPSIDQIRNMLDPIAAASLFGVFEQVYRKLHQQGVLKRFERLSNNLLVALDGTQYHSSENIHCSCCSKKTSRNGKVTYSHQALLPVIVAPGESSVISLPPAFITPQDGHEKQ